MYMADGTEVRHADDLLPLLPPDHPAARAARASAEARRRSYYMIGVTVVAIVVGLSLFSSGTSDASSTDTGPSGDQKLGLGVMVAGGIAGGIGYWVFHTRENAAKSEAFAWFTQGLAQKLDLCVVGLGVVPCEASVTPSAPR